jgi:hypothetical protein
LNYENYLEAIGRYGKAPEDIMYIKIEPVGTLGGVGWVSPYPFLDALA